MHAGLAVRHGETARVWEKALKGRTVHAAQSGPCQQAASAALPPGTF